VGHKEREEEQCVRAAELGAGGEELLLFLPTAPPMASADEAQGNGNLFLLFSIRFFHLFFTFYFFGAHTSILGQAWAEGKWGACNVPPVRGLRTGNRAKYTPP